MQPIYVMAAPPAPLRFPPKLTFAFGLCQIIAGVLCIAFQAGTMAVDRFGIMFAATGIWVGVIFIVAGGLEIGASYNKGKCLVNSTMVLSIISAVGALSAVVVTSSMGIADADNYNNSAVYALNSVLLILALFETVIAIWTSALCCRAVCCCDNTQVAGTEAFQYIATPLQMAAPAIQNGQRIVYAHQQVQQPMLATASAMNAPQPGMQAPPPGMQALPLGMQAPPLRMQAIPPGMQAPPPDYEEKQALCN